MLNLQLSWDAVFHLASQHAVLGLLHRGLVRLGTAVAPDVLARAHALRLASASDSLACTRVLVDLLELFRARGIDALPFKGPVLALQAYGDVGMRSFGDLDILVRPRDVEAACSELRAQGFVSSYPLSRARRRLLARHANHETFERADGRVVELHWRFSAPIADYAINYEHLWLRTGETSLAGHPVRILPPEDVLVLLCLHGARHAWERLGWICDVTELVRSHPSLRWDDVDAFASRVGARTVVSLGLRIALDLLDAPLPTEMARRVSALDRLGPLVRRVRTRLFMPPASGAGTLGFHLATRDGLRARLQLLAGIGGALNQEDLHDWPLPDMLLPLIYATRPARLLMKTIRRVVRPAGAHTLN